MKKIDFEKLRSILCSVNLFIIVTTLVILVILIVTTFGGYYYNQNVTLLEYQHTHGTIFDYYVGYCFFNFEHLPITNMSLIMILRYPAKIILFAFWFYLNSNVMNDNISVRYQKIFLVMATILSGYFIYYGYIYLSNFSPFVIN